MKRPRKAKERSGGREEVGRTGTNDCNGMTDTNDWH